VAARNESRVAFVMETGCVYCAVRVQSLNRDFV